MEYPSLFRSATGLERPYPYQQRLASEPWPDLLEVPTGLGKTAAVSLAWLYKRGWRTGGRKADVDEQTPRRLIWCLPMRVLVEQTADGIRRWLDRLGIWGEPGQGKVSVHMLMGGEPDLKTWAEYPEEDMVLIGTQDMLLSRALMRGYGMSRYQWPVHFALLHNDCLWVFDEVQLMGAGLATSAQLEAFRRFFSLSKQSRSLWVSATLNRRWLDTVDMRPYLKDFKVLTVGEEDQAQAGERLQARKALNKASLSLTKEAGTRRGLDTYINTLCDLVLAQHDESAQTLVILNRVERAQRLYKALTERRAQKTDLLIHARFRAAERSLQANLLRDGDSRDRIIVATQAVEAGVDISSKRLITELAPWSSMVQRFGRCNRYGEYNTEGASVLWVDIEAEADPLPYTPESLVQARARLMMLDSAGPAELPKADEPQPLHAVLRRKDLLELFNTDPDLSGFDVDVSDYIRDSGTPGVQIFWRDFKDDPNHPQPQPRPVRDELCPVSLGQARDFLKRKERALWYWDSLDRRWVRLDRDPRPGMILLARSADGGYDRSLGFDPELSKVTVEVLPSSDTGTEEAYMDDSRSRQTKPVWLNEHLAHVAEQADKLCRALGELDHRDVVVRAGRWHDVGKAHEVFQQTMHACDSAPEGFLAKSPCTARHSRAFFRHELASMLAWLSQHDGEKHADLIAYLIAAHHGKVRMSLRALPGEEARPGVQRFARGVWEGDVLPALEFDNEGIDETTLKLALMEIGEGEQGRSWSQRAWEVLMTYGPFRLAWMETLVRIADWRASEEEQKGDRHE